MAEVPRNLAAVLDALEAQRRKIKEDTAAAISRIEAQCDDELGRLDRAVAALGGSSTESAPTKTRQSATKQAAKKRRRSSCASTPAAARERREAIFRYLAEQAEPVARGQICRALKISPFATRTALTRLREEGRVTRVGTRSTTRYVAKSGRSAASRPIPPAPRSPEQGTLPGRILATIQDRGSASLDELVQATGAGREQVLRECGTLIREEEIRMGRRNGRPVYITQGTA